MIDSDIENYYIFLIFQNDLENVIPFVFLGFIYISTGPALATAKLAFRIFTAARFLHSVVYVFAVSIHDDHKKLLIKKTVLF